MSSIKQTRKEWLKAIRGQRSQNQLNRKLGYAFNQVYRWEAGYTAISWTDFIRFCRASGKDIEKALAQVLFFKGTLSDGPALFTELMADSSREEIGRILGCSRFTLGRWLGGHTAIPLESFMKLIDRQRGALVDLIASLCDIDQVPSMKRQFAKLHRRRDIHFRYPFVGAVTCCLELEAYSSLRRHQPGFIARRVGISDEEERDVLAALKRAGMIAWRDGKYVVSTSRLHIRGNFEGSHRLRLYWTERALRSLQQWENPPAKSLIGYNVFSASPEAWKQISERYFEFYNDLRSILLDDRGKLDGLYVLNLQLFDLQEMQTCG